MKLAVLASGEGTNLQAIIDAIKDGTLKNVSIEYVISDNPNANALVRAKRSGIRQIIIDKSNMVNVLDSHFDAVDLIVLAGFMKILPSKLVVDRKIINIHPSLLPLFGGKGMFGLRVHKAVLESGMKVSGATVHFVTENVDAGPIIIQECVPVDSLDTPETLQEKVHVVEHKILVKAIQILQKGKYRIEGNKVIY